ncbi:hypothetical protein H9M94_03390 [Mycoplasma sp. Pen4]|uniref:hypothetical protein n=1 Tax=Mycoplasma sp. Pen4 TaxID=640330 RepID=UPI001654578C|nr:hypothetical protein [Mycoplasma sp. Pen4]QNM93615.1 hypothetical protein H9M94_03390 [Mycoplasma sp. Pen4]
MKKVTNAFFDFLTDSIKKIADGIKNSHAVTLQLPLDVETHSFVFIDKDTIKASEENFNTLFGNVLGSLLPNFKEIFNALTSPEGYTLNIQEILKSSPYGAGIPENQQIDPVAILNLALETSPILSFVKNANENLASVDVNELFSTKQYAEFISTLNGDKTKLKGLKFHDIFTNSDKYVLEDHVIDFGTSNWNGTENFKRSLQKINEEMKKIQIANDDNKTHIYPTKSKIQATFTIHIPKLSDTKLTDKGVEFIDTLVSLFEKTMNLSKEAMDKILDLTNDEALSFLASSQYRTYNPNPLQDEGIRSLNEAADSYAANSAYLLSQTSQSALPFFGPMEPR